MAAKQMQIAEEILPDLNTRYAYVIASKNDKRGKVYDEHGNQRHENEYKPYLNVLLESSIVWKGEEDPFSKKPRAAGRHKIRYYDGCTTLFVDDQPKDKETIDSLIKGTRDIVFNYGYVFVFGYDSLLKMYMDWCSYNENSPYRVPSVDIKFKNVNTEKNLQQEGDLLEIEDTARDYAKTASDKKMRIHAIYLGIALEDQVTNQPLSNAAVRVEYRKAAKADPKEFIRSYNDKTIEVRTWVREALNTGTISTTLIPNKAVWSKSSSIIEDISGLRDTENIIDRLVEKSQTEDGGDFLTQLKSLYS